MKPNESGAEVRCPKCGKLRDENKRLRTFVKQLSESDEICRPYELREKFAKILAATGRVK